MSWRLWLVAGRGAIRHVRRFPGTKHPPCIRDHLLSGGLPRSLSHVDRLAQSSRVRKHGAELARRLLSPNAAPVRTYWFVVTLTCFEESGSSSLLGALGRGRSDSYRRR